jgi:hypothetical protein
MDKKEAKDTKDTAQSVEFYLREGNIPLILDSYDDIFSDFDPRSYSEKALSDDFLSECKRAARDKEFGAELRFFVPQAKRKLGEEKEIKKRLKDHFKKHYLILKKERKKELKLGLSFVLAGIILMLTATFILFRLEETFMSSFLIIILEPGGWFFFWEGLDIVVFRPKSSKSEQNFYKKMSDCSMKFLSY